MLPIELLQCHHRPAAIQTRRYVKENYIPTRTQDNTTVAGSNPTLLPILQATLLPRRLSGKSRQNQELPILKNRWIMPLTKASQTVTTINQAKVFCQPTA